MECCVQKTFFGRRHSCTLLAFGRDGIPTFWGLLLFLFFEQVEKIMIPKLNIFNWSSASENAAACTANGRPATPPRTPQTRRWPPRARTRGRPCPPRPRAAPGRHAGMLVIYRLIRFCNLVTVFRTGTGHQLPVKSL